MNAYSYDRTASQSFFARTLQDWATNLESDLNVAVKRYTGTQSTAGTARVEVDQTNKLEITLWLELGPEGNKAEAQEMAELLVGQRAEVEPHRLVPTTWVVHKTIQL